LRRAVEADDVGKWFREQLLDIERYVILGERDPGAVLPESAHVESNGNLEGSAATVRNVKVNPTTGVTDN
jgi:hypothetical protein